MNSSMMQILIVIGHVLMGGYFVVSGVRHFFMLPALTGSIRARKIPAPKTVLFVGAIFQIVAGLLLMAGILATAAALGLIVFSVLASFMFLDFWNKQGAARDAEINVWLANIALIGGLLVMAVQAA